MSLTNYVAERGRVYVRRFDHEEAIRRHAEGESIASLAREYGVSETSVWRVVTPGYKAREVKRNRAWRTGKCQICGGPAMRLIGGKLEHNPDGRQLCRRCRADSRRERLRFNESGTLVAVRCTSIDCANGERWQTPANFPGGTRHREVRPNGIHNACRSCQTRAKRAYRQAHPEYRRRNGGSQSKREAA